MAPPGLLPEGRYRLDSLIAAGGMGEVWRATDQLLQRQVAVKLLRQEYARDPEASVRFRAEARHAGHLSHPNIAQVFDYSEDAEDGASYLVMELVDGPSLATLLADGPVGPGYAMAVTAQVATGLAAAHTAGLVHRDIKPGNLLVSHDGLVKITDFGIAHAAGAAPVTRTGEVIGTVAYLAPERATGAQAGPSADLYALGIVAYECLTGKRPFTGDPLAVVFAHQDQEPPPLPPEVPGPVAALVADLIAKDPAARPATAAEVAARADQLRADLSAEPLRPGLPVLSGPIVNTGPQAAHRAGEAFTPAAGQAARQPEDATRPVGSPLPSAGGDGSGEPEVAGRPGPLRWLGTRARIGVAAGVLVVAGLAAWMLTGLGSHSPQARMSARTHPAATHTTSSPAPAPAGPADANTQPAVQPTAQRASSTAPASHAPSPSPVHSRPPSPSASATSSPPAPPTSPAPTPTAPGAGSGSSGP